MAISATAFQPTVSTPSRKTAITRTFTFRDFLDVLAKSLLMAQAVSDSGRPTARQVQRVRELAETI